MFRVINITFLLMGLLSSICLNAQNELGNSYIKNFDTKKHKINVSIWDITQDKKGLMYFGTGSGILQFDGTNWRTIKITNGTTARALDTDSLGRVYVGGKGEFGYLKKDSLGLDQYVSLSENLEEKYKDFADVWNIYVTKNGVFFFSFARVFQWDNNKFTVYEYEDIFAHLGFYANDNLFLVRKKAGLHMYGNGDFIPVPGGEHYIQKTIFSILPYDKDRVVVATRNEGLELLNIKTGKIVPFDNEANDAIKEGRVYHGAMSENGEYMIGTLNNGIYVIDKTGKLITHETVQNGLQSNNIKYLFKDKDGAVWAGTSMGISHIDFNLPLTSFSRENGIKGYTRDAIRFKGELYLATGNGVFYLDKNELDNTKKFKQIEGADDQFWCFLEVDGKLLVGTDGLYEIENKSLKRIHSLGGDAVFGMLRSKKNPNQIYLALKNGISLAEVTPDGEINIATRFRDYNIESHHLGEDSEGNLWVGTAYDYICKIDKASFNKSKSYPLSYSKLEYGEKLASEQIIKYNGELLFTYNGGLLRVNKNNQLEKSNSINIENLPEGYRLKESYEDQQGNLWIHYHYGDKVGMFLAIKNGANNFQIKTDPFTRVKERISHTRAPYVEENGIAWFFGGEGVVRYDYNKDIKNRKNYYANIRQISLNSDSIIGYGTNYTSLPPFVFDFKNNATSFAFSAATFSNEEEIYYQYKLEGYDDDWSEWVSLNTKEYNFLHEGDYTFKVKAKNVYNQISEEDQFSFTILAPWYRTGWAFVIYIVLFFILIYIIIKLATYRLQASKKQLEKVVEERTKDIVKEKEKVEEQKLLIEEVHSELSERNKDVMDSIKYAKRIQSSILPPLDKLTSEFEESFVLYKPRDIVSGDFYWYEKVGDYFIMACADCTGHGVPGAFMSMIGATLLNKIVEQDNIDHCKDALNGLDKEIVKTLQQTSISDNNMSMDGMDIALIAVNQKLMECHYSGAYRPLYIIRDNELIIYKANRQSIGGGINKNESFTGDVIELKSGDLLYMFTDGVTDQFGGEKNKKYKTERLKKLLLKICDQNLENQSKIINEEFETWKGDNEQIDDVLITGIKIP